MIRNFSGSIALTKLKHVVRKMKNLAGQSVDCIIIPCDSNHLVKGNNGAYYLNVRIRTTEEPDQYEQHGFISQSVDSKTYKEATEEQKEYFKTLPILGNIKDFGNPNDTAGVLPSNELQQAEDTHDDGLPF